MRYQGLCLVAILLVTTLVYLPGMTGGFAFDDYNNIVKNPHFGRSIQSLDDLETAAWSGTAGPLKRPIAMLSFALNSKAFGNWPMGYKITNLVVHLFNGVLAFFTALLIFRSLPNERLSPQLSAGAAILAAGIWLLHPINLTTVLYVVQRMTSLAAMFSFGAVIAYCWGRLRLQNQRPISGWLAIIIVCPTLIFLGAFSKENALLVVPLLFMLEALIYRFHGFGTLKLDRMLKALSVIGVIAGALIVVYLVVFASTVFTTGYDGRDFTLAERLLTEARVIWFYFFLIAVPQLQRFSLFHDDFVISTALNAPQSTLLAVIALLAVIGASFLMRRRWPIVSLAVVWFLIGHVMESTIFPLELVHEHRNYFPSFGIFVAVTYLIATQLAKRPTNNRVFVSVASVMIVIFAGLTFLRAHSWSDPVTLSLTRAEKHPMSHRSVYGAAQVLYGLYLMRGEPEHYDRAVELLLQSAALKESAKRPYFGLFMMSYKNDKPFEEAWRAELIRRLSGTFFAHTDWLELHQFVKCHASNPECQFPQQDIIDFFQAALSNPTISNLVKSQLLLDLAVFYVNEAADYEVALSMLDEAVELIPDKFSLRMTRAEIMRLAGQEERLKREIESISAITEWRDPHEYSAERISSLRTRYVDEDG